MIFTQQPLPPIMQKAFERCKLTAKKCGAETDIYQNLYAYNETAPLEYHYVSTYLHLDKLYDLIPQKNNTAVRAQVETYFQNLQEQAFAALSIFRKKISTLYQHYQPNHNMVEDHINLLQTMLQNDSLKNPNAILFNLTEINKNISETIQENSESRLRLLQLQINCLRLAVKQVIYVPIKNIIANQGNRVSATEQEPDISVIYDLLNKKKIDVIMNIILSLPDKMKAVRACLALSARVRDIIDFLLYQHNLLQTKLPPDQLPLLAQDELSEKARQTLSLSPDDILNYTTVDKEVIDRAQANWRKLIVEKNSRPAANAPNKIIMYFTTAGEDAFFDPKVFQSSLMRTNLVKQFLQLQAIADNPIATRELLQKTFLAGVYLMKFFNNLSNGLCEKSVGPSIGITKIDTTENAIKKYTGVADNIVNTVVLNEFLENYKPTKHDMILRLIDLTTFYLEAYNLSQQLALMLEPHKTTFYHKLTFIPALELTNKIIRTSNNETPAQPERTLQQMLAGRDNPVTIFTSPSGLSVVSTPTTSIAENTSRTNPQKALPTFSQ